MWLTVFSSETLESRSECNGIFIKVLKEKNCNQEFSIQQKYFKNDLAFEMDSYMLYQKHEQLEKIKINSKLKTSVH